MPENCCEALELLFYTRFDCRVLLNIVVLDFEDHHNYNNILYQKHYGWEKRKSKENPCSNLANACMEV